MSAACPHQYELNVAPYVTIPEGSSMYRAISKNETHLYFYENLNTTTMNRPMESRKLLVKLEPCHGTVLLLMRRTWPCWPNPYSCIDLRSGFRSQCEWTTLQSNIDGSHDGAPTVFETNLTSSRWFISVFATQDSAYTLTLSSDIGAVPRPGEYGNVTGTQTGELEVMLRWSPATFFPKGISSVKKYWVFSSLLLDSDNRTNPNVLVKPSKILNTVCGLFNSTDSAYVTVLPDTCSASQCYANITGVISKKRYVFNIVAESERGFTTAYSGVIMATDWEVKRTAVSKKTITIFAALAGTLIGIFMISYLWLVRIYK